MRPLDLDFDLDIWFVVIFGNGLLLVLLLLRMMTCPGGVDGRLCIYALGGISYAAAGGRGVAVLVVVISGVMMLNGTMVIVTHVLFLVGLGVGLTHIIGALLRTTAVTL